MDVQAKESCFHCGLSLAPGREYSVVVDGVRQPVCCAGCEAGANLIVSQGLERFYQFRSTLGSAPTDAQQDWSVFDREAALRR